MWKLTQWSKMPLPVLNVHPCLSNITISLSKRNSSVGINHFVHPNVPCPLAQNQQLTPELEMQDSSEPTSIFQSAEFLNKLPYNELLVA